MSRKDFVLIARTIETLPQWAPMDGSTLRSVAVHFANMLADNNPRFDKSRFLAACGVEV